MSLVDTVKTRPENLNGCPDCNKTITGEPCPSLTYPLAPPQWMERNCMNPGGNELIAKIYNNDSGVPNPRVAKPHELSDGCIINQNGGGSARYVSGDLIMFTNITSSDGVTCKVMHKAGVLATTAFDGSQPIELMSGSFLPFQNLALSRHNWVDFNEVCGRPHCHPGPYEKICGTCLTFAMSFGNILGDDTELSDVLFNWNEHCGMWAGLYYDASCPDGMGKGYAGNLVIDPSTLSRSYDANVHQVKIRDIYRDWGAYYTEPCNGADRNVRLLVEFHGDMFQ